MNKLEHDDLIMIIGGGLNITGVLVNAFTNAGKFIYSLGQTFGSSLRRIGEKNVCPIR